MTRATGAEQLWEMGPVHLRTGTSSPHMLDPAYQSATARWKRKCGRLCCSRHGQWTSRQGNSHYRMLHRVMGRGGRCTRLKHILDFADGRLK